MIFYVQIYFYLKYIFELISSHYLKLYQNLLIQIKSNSIQNRLMNYEQSLKRNASQLESTRLPGYTGYNSVRSFQHPTQMRVTGRYGQSSIPAGAFLNRQSQIPQQQTASYNLGRTVSQPNLADTQVYQNGVQQMHYPLPQYNYGIQQQCTPHASYRLPVYYEEPMQVREEWERPLDPLVKQQEWRFVKTQDKGGIVKYVPKDQQFVPTHQSQWENHYNPKTSIPPVIPHTRQIKTCCTPMLFALLGLLALLGLILGLVLLLNAHKTNLSPPVVSKTDSVEPTKGKATQQIPAISSVLQPGIKVNPNPIPVTRPTFSDPISVRPNESVTTATSISASSTSKVDSVSAVDISYGYQQNTLNTGSSINYNNDYQIRQPINQPITTVTTVNPSLTGGYSTPIQSTSVNNGVTGVGNLSPSGNYEYRVPQGYRVDQQGLLVRI